MDHGHEILAPAVKAEKEKQDEGAIVVIAPDGSLISASSLRELAEKVRAYREGR
jgi:hypothetical protein